VRPIHMTKYDAALIGLEADRKGKWRASSGWGKEVSERSKIGQEIEDLPLIFSPDRRESDLEHTKVLHQAVGALFDIGRSKEADDERQWTSWKLYSIEGVTKGE
jgi:hypothetical protein